MTIPYDYEITRVDEQARCMEVEYRSQGYKTRLVSMRLPFVGESLEGVIDSCSPVLFWELETKPVIVPKVGTKGSWPPKPLDSQSIG